MIRTAGILILVGLISICASGKETKRADLNTAANASYLSSLEKEVIYEINLFRSNPAKYSELYIAPLANYYDSKILRYPGDKSIRTVEGVRALNECVRELKKMSYKPILNPDKSLSLSARDHQLDQQKSGLTGHTGTDHSNLRQRIERYGTWQTRIGENIAYGNSNARQIVVFLLIDDGVRDRGHRATLLNPDFKVVGLACGKHPVYETMCVLDFAGGMIEK
ncbi:CAP domain-containing protein [Maribellus sediminis]|uniref:CAP domain-containing protein n=1 Tax=Maribellus sediminis TaxID=2696285 RepID=UPI0014312DA2|nr:CAP domain-containing protein [Maribellus sediminis]